MARMSLLPAAANAAVSTDRMPVLTTALDGLLAVAGGFVSGSWAERRADAREQQAREHEREVWARGLRYEAHVAFLSIRDAKFRLVSEAKDDPFHAQHGREPSEDYLMPVWDRYQALQETSRPPDRPPRWTRETPSPSVPALWRLPTRQP